MPCLIRTVGGGDSHLVDALLEKGYSKLYVLDISVQAIERARKRLGKNANKAPLGKLILGTFSVNGPE